MILLLAGASHTGKTRLAQTLLERCHYPYLSIDHLKMGLIRSGQTSLSPEDDNETLTDYLWPIVKEIVKTAIENRQNLIIEGCYIPFDWKKDFSPEYQKEIRFYCLVFTRRYILNHFDDILTHACDIENRHNDSDCTKEMLLAANARNEELCKQYGCARLVADDGYTIDLAQ